MSAPTRPRGPLPRRVYWVRRLVVLVVLALVVGAGLGLVTAMSGWWRGGAERPVATPAGAAVAVTPDAAAQPSPGRSPAQSPTAPGGSPSGSLTASPPRASREPLPEPEGVCPDEDVVVSPTVPDAHVGQPIRIVLEVSTKATPACTWEVSPDSVFLRVSRGADGEVVWSSQECPAVMPTAQVVARQQQAAEVVVSWSGRMSDAECSALAGWVLPGRYRAESVARGAVTPLDERFRLQDAVPETVVVTPTPTPTPSAGD